MVLKHIVFEPMVLQLKVRESEPGSMTDEHHNLYQLRKMTVKPLDPNVLIFCGLRQILTPNLAHLLLVFPAKVRASSAMQLPGPHQSI